jgi:hypothetical protein
LQHPPDCNIHLKARGDDAPPRVASQRWWKPGERWFPRCRPLGGHDRIGIGLGLGVLQGDRNSSRCQSSHPGRSAGSRASWCRVVGGGRGRAGGRPSRPGPPLGCRGGPCGPGISRPRRQCAAPAGRPQPDPAAGGQRWRLGGPGQAKHAGVEGTRGGFGSRWHGQLHMMQPERPVADARSCRSPLRRSRRCDPARVPPAGRHPAGQWRSKDRAKSSTLCGAMGLSTSAKPDTSGACAVAELCRE